MLFRSSRVCYSYFIRTSTYEASYETTIPVRSKKMSNDWIPSTFKIIIK